jgi:hypothetical protein
MAGVALLALFVGLALVFPLVLYVLVQQERTNTRQMDRSTAERTVRRDAAEESVRRDAGDAPTPDSDFDADDRFDASDRFENDRE